MDEKECTIQDCDIFDFMARHVGMTVIHPGGLKATHGLAESLNIDKNSRVVDIACGKGTTAVYLAQKYACQVVGIDISRDLIAEAEALTKRRGLGGKVSFRVGDALEMPFSDNEFDAAISQAMLILVKDKKKAIEESLRITKPGGRVGWLELSWKKPPTKEFLEAVSNVLCAYCMLKVHTFEDWEKLFKKAGVKQLKIRASSMEFGGMRGMLGDEDFSNAFKIMFRFLTNSKIKKRLKTMNKFFMENSEYFGFGTYIGEK